MCVHECVRIHKKREMGSLIKEAWKRLVYLQTIHLNLPAQHPNLEGERESMARETLASFQGLDQVDVAFSCRLPLINTMY